jgi:hypothetical protein
MYKLTPLLAMLAVTLTLVSCTSGEPGEQGSTEEAPEETVEETTPSAPSQAGRFEDLEPGETATFQNGLELTLTDAGIITTPTTPPAMDKSGRPKASDPNRVLQNMIPGGTELLAFRFHAENNEPEGGMPARIDGLLTCRDVNGVKIPSVAAQGALRAAIRAEAGLGELSRQAAPAQQLSGRPIEGGQERDALVVCEQPLAGGEVEVGVALRAQGAPGQEPPGAFWKVDPEELGEFPPDRI